MFAGRRPLLTALMAGRVSEPDIDRFVETFQERPGRYSIVDPSSVFGDDESDAPFFTGVLGSVEKGDLQALTALDTVGSVVGGFRNGPDNHLGDVLGYYVAYGTGEA